MILTPLVVVFVFGLGMTAIDRIESMFLASSGKRLTDDQWIIMMMYCLVSALVAAFGVTLFSPM